MKKRWVSWLKILIGVALITVLVVSERLELHRLLAIRERWGLFLAAQVVFLCSLFTTIVRWQLLLRALDVPTRFMEVLRLGWIGLLFNQVIPGTTGGDVVKGYYIARECPERRAEAVLSVVLDRVIGLTALMLVGGVALLVNRQQILENAFLTQVGWLLAVLVVVLLGGGALLAWESFWRQPWIQRLLQRIPFRNVVSSLARALWTLRGKRKILCWTLGLSIVNHFGIVFTHVLLAASLLGETPSLAAYFFLIPVGQLAFALPISPGGLGIGELVYDSLFTQMDQSSGAEVAALMRLTWVLWSLVGVYFYFRGRKELKEAAQAAQETSLLEKEAMEGASS
ncbi:MAG: lysylphosphatidylglycerol synthase transmembrane domain-containing protein [Planctomycetota bacterium]